MAVRVDPIASYRIPKPSGGTRVMARLTAHDAARWESAAASAAPAIEARLGPAILGNRVRPGSGTLRLRPLDASLTAARRAAARLARDSSVVIRTDVASFYPSITPTVLADGLRETTGPADARLAAGMVEGWGSEGYTGLPIGPDGSAVLANAILAPVDRALAGVPFLRWVDDYLVAVLSERQAEEVLERLDLALDRLGLRRSLPKTRRLEGGRSLPWPGTLSGP
ncbi:MAG: RNA-directed DNA polymerase [Actinomycetota bacterium]